MTSTIPTPGKRQPQELQTAFLTDMLDRMVTVYLVSGIKLSGKLRQFDQYTLLLQGTGHRFLDLQARYQHHRPRRAGRDTGAPDALRQKARVERVTAHRLSCKRGQIEELAPVLT